MKLRIRAFELSNGKYTKLSELARAMGIATAQIYRVRRGAQATEFILGHITGWGAQRAWNGLETTLPTLTMRDEKVIGG